MIANLAKFISAIEVHFRSAPRRNESATRGILCTFMNGNRDSREGSREGSRKSRAKVETLETEELLTALGTNYLADTLPSNNCV